MKLREYQSTAADAVMREFETNDSTLLVLPTGCGKTVVFAEIIRRFQPKRAMVVAHREELIFQARKKIWDVTGLDADIEMGELAVREELWGRKPVVVSTIQTQISGRDGRGRMTHFNPDDFGLLIIDESHHGTSKSYKKVIEHYRRNPFLKVLGVTATPDRTDEEALGQVFQTVAFDYEILDAINDGYLVPIDQQMIHVHGLDFSAVRTTAGDLNGADLAAIMESEHNMQEVAGSSLEVIKNRRTLIFTASVKQAETLSEIFNRHRPGMANWVCGKTPKEERQDLLKRFETGETQVVVNCGVLTEGYDNPAVEVVIMARPTKSRSLYSQMVGRGTRPLDGVMADLDTPESRRNAIERSAKPALLVIDFVGNSGRHKLVTSADILGGKSSPEAVELAKEFAKEKGGVMRMVEVMAEAEDELKRRREEAKQKEEARKARLVAKAQFSMTAVNPFNTLDIAPMSSRGWDNGKTLTEKQRGLLLKQGINPDQMPYGAAKQLVDELFRRWGNNLCSLKQAQLLKKHGYETKDLKREDASKLIDALAKNGWRRPT